ncbi:MAG TPA: MFS transporter [Bryobacteraceae bacterium]|nr:MFS transporter [Bryobacteraceae bacterium]
MQPDISAQKSAMAAASVPWYKELNSYHWLVLVVASLGWMFDTMDQQLFNLARRPAIIELLGAAPGDPRIQAYGGYATAIFMIGWALGGIVFGILGDRIGRVKTMITTILFYSAFTGLSVLSTGVWDFSAYRFLTGLGVGGQFAVGVSLVAETMPDRARPFALGWLQALSAVGNMMAALAGMTLGHMEESGLLAASAWRYMFIIGTLPALLAIIVFKKLHEPESWVRARAEKKKLGSMGDLFSDPRWRKNSIVGMLLALSGVVGLWGIGFFSFDLLRSVLDAQGLGDKATFWTGVASLLQNGGAFFGIYAFTHLTARIGRRKAFAISFVAAMGATAFTFWNLDSISDIFWMIPIMGFCQLALFGGYAIYLPELFPTRLRSTGTSFCYNVGRLAAALGPFFLGQLSSGVFGGFDEVTRFRYAGVTMCAAFLIGLLALPFAPETKDQPLPE